MVFTICLLLSITLMMLTYGNTLLVLPSIFCKTFFWLFVFWFGFGLNVLFNFINCVVQFCTCILDINGISRASGLHLICKKLQSLSMNPRGFAQFILSPTTSNLFHFNCLSPQLCTQVVCFAFYFVYLSP